MIPNPEGFKVVTIDSLDKALPRWDFLMLGLKELNEKATNGRVVTMPAFLSVLADCIDRGITLFVDSKKGKPLLYVMAFESTSKHTPDYRTLWIYACYSNSLIPSVSQYALAYVEDWARKEGFSELQTQTQRFQGSRIRLFTKRWGFRQRAITFTKAL